MPRSIPRLTHRRRWVGAIFLFVVGDGLTLHTRGPLLRSFEADFGVSEGLLGLVSPAGTIGFVAAVIVVGFLAGRLDIRRWVLGGIAVTAMALLLMSGAPVYGLLLVFLFAQGTAAGAVRGLDRVVLSHLYPDNRGRVFTLHSLAWSVGAVSGPLFVNRVLAVTDWRAVYLVLGVWFLPLFVLLLGGRLPGDVENERTLSLESLNGLLRRPLVLGMMVAILLVGALEGIIYTWLPFYASEFISLERANRLLTLYLLAYIPARLLYSWVVGYVGDLPLAFVLSVAAIGPTWVMLSGIEGTALVVAAMAAGFFIAGLFPLISAFAVAVAPEYSGPLSALATGATYVGLAIGPLAVGLLAEWTGIALAIRSTVAMAAGISIALAVIWIVR